MWLFESLYLGAVWILHSCASFSLVAGSQDSSPVAVQGLPIAVASLSVEHQLWGARASVAAHTGLGAPWHMESSWIGD